MNNSKVKTASKLCSALTLSGLVEVKEVCWEMTFFAGNLNRGSLKPVSLCQTIQRESGGNNSPESEVISVTYTKK